MQIAFPKSLSFGALAVAAALLTALPATAANIVNNGSFETGDLTGWSGTVLSDPFSGVYCPGAGLAPSGSCEAFLGSSGTTDTLSQILSTVAGQSYAISFALLPDGSAPSSFSVSFGSQVLYSVNNPALAASAQTFTLFASALTNSTALTFRFENDPGYFVLDAVSAAPVPEPETYALMALGLLGVVVRRKWQRRQR